MPWTIREARLSDHEALCALWAEVGALHARAVPAVFTQPDGPERSREELGAMLADPDVTVLVAQAESIVVGYTQASVLDAPHLAILTPRRYGKINDLGVTAAWRHRGIGRALIAAAEAWAVAQGATSIELNVWAFNTGARALYEALGYVPQSTRLAKPLPMKGTR